MPSPTMSAGLIPTLVAILYDCINVPQQEALREAIALLDPTPENSLSLAQLEDKYRTSTNWGHHHTYHRQWWMDEVAKEDTICGYWEWVYNKIQNEDEPE